MVDNVTPPTPEEAADDPRIAVDEQPAGDPGEQPALPEEDVLPDAPLDEDDEDDEDEPGAEVASTDPR